MDTVLVRKNSVVVYCNYIVDCTTKKIVDCKKTVSKININ